MAQQEPNHEAQQESLLVRHGHATLSDTVKSYTKILYIFYTKNNSKKAGAVYEMQIKTESSDLSHSGTLAYAGHVYVF